MTKRLKVSSCSACRFMSGMTDDCSRAYCVAEGLRKGTGDRRPIPETLDIDTSRPKWCPLPILVEATPPKVTPEPEHRKDVHTEHCCEQHRRCKYADRECTVAKGEKHASFSCNCAHF